MAPKSKFKTTSFVPYIAPHFHPPPVCTKKKHNPACKSHGDHFSCTEIDFSRIPRGLGNWPPPVCICQHFKKRHP
jgi:hypothetical protein